MAADRAGPYSLRRPLVLAILAIAARRRRAARRARTAAVRSRTGVNASGGISSRPTNPGAWTKPTFASRAAVATCIGPSIRPVPRVINTDLAPLYGAAVADIKEEGILRRRCRHRPVHYLNNILEQDHRAIKRRVNAKQGFREFQAACRTIQGYEAMNMIRKGQARWVGGTNVRHQIHFIQKLFELPA